MSDRHERFAVVVPVGPGPESVLDTLQSVEIFCPEAQAIILVDDCTDDGTYAALLNARQPHWEVLRNPRRHGIRRLVHTLCSGYLRALEATQCELVLRLDQDALLIKPGLVAEAMHYVQQYPQTGMFGVYDVDYDRPRSFQVHRRLINRELALSDLEPARRPFWAPYLELAERHGYHRGDNVFGGAYFITRKCLEAVKRIGGLHVPWEWNSRMQEDVYFSLMTVAAGYRMGHFAAPDGPLCLEWRGLPYPAAALAISSFKLVHSVDKGKNTGAADNAGQTAREIFRELRVRHVASVPPVHERRGN